MSNEFTYKESISRDAIKCLEEIQEVGGSITRADNKHDRLFNMEGFNECSRKDFIQKSDGGTQWDYIKFDVTPKGADCLLQFNHWNGKYV